MQDCATATCDIRGTHACAYDASAGSIVCDLSGYTAGCDLSDPGFSVTAVSTTKDVISIYGSCSQPDPNDPEITFCCEHDQSGGHGIQTLDLIGTDKTEELMSLRDVDLITGDKLNLEKHSTVGEMSVTVQGNSGNEAIHGSNFVHAGYVETLLGGPGVDSITAGDGDDVVFGGADGDFLHGGKGVDILRGEAGNDFLYGNDGDDRLYGGSGDDQIWGHAGHDRIWGNQHTDTIYGGANDDTIYGGNNDDFLYGESGDDTLYGQHGDDRLEGGTGDDDLSGGVADDWLEGGDDNDKLHGGAGEDYLFGESGVDWLYGGYDSDQIRGGKGDDVICENQNYTGPPGGSQGAVARNYMSGGDDDDVLHLDTYYYFNVPVLHTGDNSVESGFYDIQVEETQLLDGSGQRDGDFDPNAVECTTLVSMFGQ